MKASVSKLLEMLCCCVLGRECPGVGCYCEGYEKMPIWCEKFELFEEEL